jgi:hypothetical protein
MPFLSPFSGLPVEEVESPSNYTTTTSFHIDSNSLFTIHPAIEHYIVSAIESIIKLIEKWLKCTFKFLHMH